MLKVDCGNNRLPLHSSLRISIWHRQSLRLDSCATGYDGQTRLTQKYFVSLVVSQLGRRDRITPDNATTPGALPCLNPMPEQSHLVFHAFQHLPLIPVQEMQCFGQQLLVPRLVANLLAKRKLCPHQLFIWICLVRRSHDADLGS